MFEMFEIQIVDELGILKMQGVEFTG